MRMRASDIRSMLSRGSGHEWFGAQDLREKWEHRPDWLRSPRSRSVRLRRPAWLGGRRKWYERWSKEAQAQDVLKGVLAGAIGGLAGSLLMVLTKSAIQKFSQRRENAARPAREYAQVKPGGLESERFGYGEPAEMREWRPPRRQVQEEPPTEKLAHKISRGIMRRELSPGGKHLGGQVVHYGYGTAMGAIYGGLAEVAPPVTAGLGMPAATVLWAVSDEMALPALRLSKRPREYSLSQHAMFLGTHLIYGFTTELIRRTLRRMMD